METQSGQDFGAMGSISPIQDQEPHGKPAPSWNLLIGIVSGGILTLLCLACLGAGLVVNSMGLGQDCKTRGPSWLDVFWVQNYSQSFFEGGGWKKSFTSAPDRVTMSWLSDKPSAVAYLEYTVYECGFSSSYLQDEFNDNNFKTVLFNSYQNVTRIAECSQNDLHLYEYKAQFSGSDYRMDFWTQPEGPTRWLSFSLSFPAANQDVLDTYARQIHPELSSCP